MVCTNWMLTILAIVIFVFTMWPSLLGTATTWIIAISAVLILIIAWTGVECKFCKKRKQARNK